MTTLVPGIIFMGRKWGEKRCAVARGGFFIFLFLFFTKIYFRFQNLQEYTPAAPLPGGRDLVAPLRGGRVFFIKILRNFLQKSPWRTGRPVAGRPAPRPPSSRAAGPGRPAAGRPAPPPLYKGWLVPPLLICITKIPETKKREGERRSPAGFSSRRLQVAKILLRFTNRLCCNYFC